MAIVEQNLQIVRWGRLKGVPLETLQKKRPHEGPEGQNETWRCVRGFANNVSLLMHYSKDSV